MLLFRALRGREELARLSLLEIWALSTRADIPPSGLLGKSVTVTVERGGGGYRYFNGYVTAFGQEAMVGRYYQYRLTVHPWLWFLTRTTDCRIFQDKTVPEIVKAIFAEHPVAAFEDSLSGQYVAARVLRPVSGDGLQLRQPPHGRGGDVLLLRAHGRPARAPAGRLPLRAQGARGQADHSPSIPRASRSAWRRSSSTPGPSPRASSPGYSRCDDHDFTKPNVDLAVKAQVIQKHEHAGYEVFDWPGDHAAVVDGERLPASRIDELHAEFERAEAQCNVREIAVGRLFTLTNAPRRDQEGDHLIVERRVRPP